MTRMAVTVQSLVQRIRPWLTLAGVVLTAGVLLPPGASLARQYAFAQAVQFAVLALAVPALVVLGAPWRLTSVPADQAGGLAADRAAGRRLADRVAIARSHQPGTARAWAILVGFIAVTIFWRMPVVVNATVGHPILPVVEAVTLITAGCALWLELVESPPLLPRISRPQRAAFAALPMWTIWAIAYIMGFARGTWFAAFRHLPGHGLGTIADQEIAAGLLWAIPALCFVPVIYFALITWLRDSSDPDSELHEVPAVRGAGQPHAPRPPRGWRLPSA